MANVDDYSGSAQLLAATTLRNVLGTRNLGDILADREAIAHEMQSGLDEATDSWGVLVERVEVGENVLRYFCFWLRQNLIKSLVCVSFLLSLILLFAHSWIGLYYSACIIPSTTEPKMFTLLG